MSKLKITALSDDKPVKVMTELPASVHRDLVAYAEALARETGQAIDPIKLVAPMLARFMAADRGFAKSKRVYRSVGDG
ncbi:DUF2274 domain-containing protein [Bradyrhizobium barranii subsp. apii]|uniref:DUF2274 domain-containing protein n=2 Tax=Bradyrhizobium barranii TaxID=2992140 RepID=A0A850IQR0_9BRAD|nr:MULTISPECIES: DUF2274 domain-containing protein [Bradyrhizobium]MCK1277562.1 DUF2274 domain-containing protein [Bradyrhizobium sp. 61]MCK1445263.1 DUF2274 domain-containing protein [Bradyrhizobium sp. 48]MCK1458925.1 DUF2274 domain-containing protein [Bradyrhizobium sp. 2]UEM10065.1 DUF2274 domain-containing protein [Bradyrhizobium barranii subsp. barranii]UPT90337.1 DUF2274 domain-containing protein [Bradyrhizobium barranii subsp. apii]